MGEIGLARGGLHAPVWELPAVVLDDGGERQSQRRRTGQRRESAEMHGRGQLELLRGLAHLQPRSVREARRCHAVTVVGELVRRPRKRRREVELEVPGYAWGGDERLEAGVLPQAIGPMPV